MKRLRALLAAALLALAAAPAFAQSVGGVRVSPVSLAIGRQGQTTSFRLVNLSGHARAFEVSPRAWSQDDGADVLAETAQLIVTPAVFELQPGRTQIVRAALAPGFARRAEETCFRLLVHEFTLEDAPRAQGLRLTLDLSLPLFVVPDGAARPGALAARRIGDAVEIANVGGAHLRLVEVRAGAALLAQTPRYLLPGALFRRPAGPGEVSALAARDDGAMDNIVLADAPDQRSGR